MKIVGSVFKHVVILRTAALSLVAYLRSVGPQRWKISIKYNPVKKNKYEKLWNQMLLKYVL